MEKVPEHIKKVSAEFMDNIREAYGDAVRSITLYGPAARGETAKKTPYINFMVVLEDNTPSELAKCSKYLKQWRKQLIATPLFLNPEYITNSLDTFPLEFLDMTAAYAVVKGDDLLADLTFDDNDVRSQCEREIKGKLLHLRAEYLNLRGDKKGIIDLVNRSLSTFRLVFTGALYLKDADIPQDTETLLALVTEEYGLDAALLNKLVEIARGRTKIDEVETDRLFDLYVEELDKLSDILDKIEWDNGE